MPRPSAAPEGEEEGTAPGVATYLSHRSQKAMLQPCVHQHCREASVVSSSVTSAAWPGVRTRFPWTPLKVSPPKEHRFGGKAALMGFERG
ncbi:unnamed protein product [Lota lota]